MAFGQGRPHLLRADRWTVLAFVVMVSLFVYAGRARPNPTTSRVRMPTEGMSWRGNPRAQIAFVTVSDFQCPFCMTLANEILPAIEQRYSASLRLGFKHFPLEQIHPQALAAAVAAECAAEDGKFWPMHDLLFELPSALDEVSVKQKATTLHLPPTRFASCLANAETVAKVRSDATWAREIGIRSTPTSLLGRVAADGSIEISLRMPGVRSVSDYSDAIDNLLKGVH